MSSPEEDRALDIHETARLLNVSPRTIHRMIADGEIRPFKVRGQLRFLLSEVERIRHGSSADVDADRRDE